MRGRPYDPEPVGAQDPLVSYPMVTERNLPGGARCYDCGRPLLEGFPYTSHLVAVGPHHIVTHVACVYCTACPDDSAEPALPDEAAPGALE
jgi:hypothetical protein